jgi:hypothetical protein
MLGDDLRRIKQRSSREFLGAIGGKDVLEINSNYRVSKLRNAWCVP